MVSPPLQGLVVAAVSVLGCSGSSSKIPAKNLPEPADPKPPTANTISQTEKTTWSRRPIATSPAIAEHIALAERVGARPISIENPCLDPRCGKRSLTRIFRKLRSLEQSGQETVRILQLGDSQIAADYITRTVRARLQERFGHAGRGFVAIDQRAEFGGRRLRRKGWRRRRIVDETGPGRPFGFSGMYLESRRRDAYANYLLEPEDRHLAIYYYVHRRGSKLRVFVGRNRIGRFSTRSRRSKSRVRTFALPENGDDFSTEPKKLRILAEGRGARLFGLSFESSEPGVLYDSIGPVGADAKVYLSLGRRSFEEQLQSLMPDLVMLMVGGNDALMMRQGKRSIASVKKQHRRLIQRLKSYLPDADCLLWSPMDAGEHTKDGRIVSKEFLVDVRNAQRALAEEMGCAFWDTFESMGAKDAFGRWHDAGLMNDDLVHPRSAGGDLLGHLFWAAFMNAYVEQE